MLNLQSELRLGSIASVLPFFFVVALFLVSIPMVFWLVISISRWRKRKQRKAFTWWAVTVGIFFALGLSISEFSNTFANAAYSAASQVHIYVPTSVRVLENYTGPSFFGTGETYTVVQFTSKQSISKFIDSAKNKGWKHGDVVPYSLLTPPNGLHPSAASLMSGRTYPFPKTKRRGYYSYSRKTFMETIRRVYFLDTKTKILYIFYYQGQP